MKELIEEAMADERLTLRQAVLIALASSREVCRLASNAFAAMKRWEDCKKPGPDLIDEWVGTQAPDSLCHWYARDYYDIDVLELLLDLRLGLL